MKRLYRSQEDRILAGILGGLGKYFNVDPTMIRLIFIVALFFSFGTLVFAYLIAVLIVPNEWEVK